MIFWFNFYFCIATEVSTNKETTLVFYMIFLSLNQTYINTGSWSPIFSSLYHKLYIFKRPLHTGETVLSTSLLWLGSNLGNL